MKTFLVGLSGVVVGGALLWLSLRQFDRQQFAQILASFDVRYMLAACGLYWLGIAIRSSRWHALLNELRDVTWWSAAEVLVIGHAANNLLPARLGEFVRAEYAKKRFSLTRSMLLGTILVERMLDLTIVLACLLAGLALGAVTINSAFAPAVKGFVINGLVVMAVLGLAIKLLGSRLRGFKSVAELRIVRDLFRGISSLNARSAVLACTFSCFVWMCESCSLWLAFKTIHIELSFAQTILMLGASSLSTLLPTAPGYVGSFQLIFVLAMAAFGIPETAGLVVSVLIQIFMFGSVTVVALLLYFVRALVESKRGIRPGQVSQRERIAHG